MGWENVYPSKTDIKKPLQQQSIYALVYEHLQTVPATPKAEWDKQIRALPGSLQQPYIDNLRKCAVCVAQVWGVFAQMREARESMGPMVKALTAFVPSSGPASWSDLVSIAADVASDYIGSYRNAVTTKIQSDALSQEQLAILALLNPANWKPNQTVGQWATELLDIGEYGIRLVESAKDPSRIHKVNVDAMAEYMRVVRPLLYCYVRDRGNLPLTSVH